MTFAYEREMAGPVIAWLGVQRLMVKREFPTPWGICDLVGCSLNERKVLLKAEPAPHDAGSVIQHYCVERFWQLYLQGSRS